MLSFSHFFVLFQAKYISRLSKEMLPSFTQHNTWRNQNGDVPYQKLPMANGNGLTSRMATSVKHNAVTNLLLNGTEEHFPVSSNNKLLFV